MSATTQAEHVQPAQKLPLPPEQRLWAKVDRRGPDECWTWMGCVTPTGHGLMATQANKREYVRRIAWELEYGFIPGGMAVYHRCGNRRCVNPAHLSLNAKGQRRAGQENQPMRQWACRAIYRQNGLSAR